MGYTRIVQFGDVTQVYKYEREYHYKERPPQTRIQKKRAQERRKLSLRSRSKRSIYRSRMAFFRLCHHNNVYSSTITFLTLTFAYDVQIEKAQRALSEFFRRLSKKIDTNGVSIRYISVPEFTKKGRIHYHILVYDLPPEIPQSERITRNIQRQWRHGYADARIARYTSPKIAGYMAKYMAKTFDDQRIKLWRGYTCSRNIEVPTSTGSNSLSGYMDMIVDNSFLPTEEKMYDTQYFGRCKFSQYKKVR